MDILVTVLLNLPGIEEKRVMVTLSHLIHLRRSEFSLPRNEWLFVIHLIRGWDFITTNF